LNERGGIESDLTALRLKEDHYRLYVGTAAIRRDLAWLERHLENENVSLEDTTLENAVVGVMGPKAAGAVSKLGANVLNDLGYFQSGQVEIAGCRATGVRLSYVGEAGWEITCKATDAGRIYDALYEEGARPAGTLAQTSMRIEKRFLSYGHDLDTDISPLEAGLNFAIDWHADFIGRSALEAQRDRGVTNRIVSIILQDDNAVPLGSEPVHLEGRVIGKTTSAGFGYRVGKPIAIADVSVPGTRIDGAMVDIDIAGERFAGSIVLGAVYDPSGSRMRKAPSR
jgi:glycine cleavage system aminomethyltransferase T